MFYIGCDSYIIFYKLVVAGILNKSTYGTVNLAIFC